jgi:hypothetical protein
MIGGEGVETGFYVGEVAPEENSHVGIKASAIRYGCIGMRALPSGTAILSPRRLREPARGEAVSDIPSDARQLACAIGCAQAIRESGLVMRLFQRRLSSGCIWEAQLLARPPGALIDERIRPDILPSPGSRGWPRRGPFVEHFDVRPSSDTRFRRWQHQRPGPRSGAERCLFESRGPRLSTGRGSAASLREQDVNIPASGNLRVRRNQAVMLLTLADQLTRRRKGAP